MLFKKTRQYNIQNFNKNIFFKYRMRQIKATEELNKKKQQTNNSSLLKNSISSWMVSKTMMT